MNDPRPIATAPRDGTLFDITRDGVPYLDCCFDDNGRLYQNYDYPSIKKLFNMSETWQAVTFWTSRPVDRIKPYETSPLGLKYIP